MTANEFRVVVIESLTQLKGDVRGIQDHLARLNGSVARHEADLNQQKIVEAGRTLKTEEMAKSIAENKTAIEEHKKESEISNATMLKIAAIASATVLAITKAGGPVLELVLKMLR